jgi:hypothetical protein
MQHFCDRSDRGLIPYRDIGGYYLQLAGIAAGPELKEPLFRAFPDFARAQGKRVQGVQLRDHDLGVYRRAGFRVNSIGCSYTLDIRDFTLAGTRFMRMRNKLRQPQKLGIEVGEVGAEIGAQCVSAAELERISQGWLGARRSPTASEPDGATRAITYMVRSAPTLATMDFYATQLVDEARHAYVFREHLVDLGFARNGLAGTMAQLIGEKRRRILDPLEALGREVGETRDFVGGVIVLAVIAEGALAPAADGALGATAGRGRSGRTRAQVSVRHRALRGAAGRLRDRSGTRAGADVGRGATEDADRLGG